MLSFVGIQKIMVESHPSECPQNLSGYQTSFFMRSKSFYDLLCVYNVIQVLILDNAVASWLHPMLLGLQLARFCVLVLDDTQFVFKAPCYAFSDITFHLVSYIALKKDQKAQ